MNPPGFSADLKKLASTVATAVKYQAAGESGAAREFEAAVKLAEQLDWIALLEALKTAREAESAKHQANMEARREKLLLAARTAGVQHAQGTRTVRVDIFRVEFEGESAIIFMGGVEVDRTKEVDGEKLFEFLRELRGMMEKSPFSRVDFFRQVQSSYATCRRTGTLDEFVSVLDLHRELFLERARLNEAFRKRPEPKNVPEYPLHQFVFDLARFIQKGVAVGDERLFTTTPSMRESASTVFVPNLEHPLASETPAARLAIKRNA